MTGQILLAWLKLLALDGDLAKAAQDTALPVLHTAARLVRGGRKRRLKIQATWPWAEAITAARMKPTGLTPVSNLMSLVRGDHRSITALSATQFVVSGSCPVSMSWRATS